MARSSPLYATALVLASVLCLAQRSWLAVFWKRNEISNALQVKCVHHLCCSFSIACAHSERGAKGKGKEISFPTRRTYP